MDYSKLSNEELIALKNGDYSKLSDDTLKSLSKSRSTTESNENIDDNLSNQAKALGLGAASGASFGFSDELEAGAKSAVSDKNYDNLIKDIRNRNKKYEDTFPITSTVGKLAGGAGSMLLGGAALAGTKLAGLAAGMAADAPVLSTMATGAVSGALSGAGDSEATNAKELAKDTLLGGGGGALAGSILGGAGKVLSGATSMAAELPVVSDIVAGFKGGTKPLYGKAIPLSDSLNEKVTDKFLKPIISAEKNIKNAYTDLYTAADSKIAPLSTDDIFEKLTNKLNQITDIDNPNRIVLVPDEKKDIISYLKSLIGKTGEKSTEDAPEGLMLNSTKNIKESHTLKDLAGVANAMQSKIDSSESSSGYALSKLKSFIKDDIISDSLPEDAKNTLNSLNQKYNRLSELKSSLGIKTNLDDSADGFSKNKQAFKDISEKTTKLMEKGVAEDSNDSATRRDVKDIFNNFGTVVASPDKAAALQRELAEDVDSLGVAKNLTKRAILETSPLTAGLSGTSLKTLAGYAPRRAYENTKDLVTASLNYITPEKIQQLAESPAMTKFADKLSKIANSPDVSFRRAAMFSLGQQPAFRESLKEHLPTEDNTEK